MKIWHIDKKEIENSKAIRRLVCRTAVTAVKFDATGTLLAASSTDGAITLFDPHSGELLYTIEGNGKATTSLAFHPTEQKLAAASYDQPLRVWALLSAMPRPSFNVFSSMATLDQANLFHSLQKCARKRQQLSKQVNAGEIASADDRTVMEEIEKRHPNVYEAMLSLCAKTGISYTKNPTKEVNLADNLSFMQTLTE